MSRTARFLWVATVFVLIVVAFLFSYVTDSTSYVRDRVVSALNARFASQVELASLEVSLFPRPQMVGRGLVLRQGGRTDVAPLLTIPSFMASAGFLGLRANPLHLANVELDGLDIRIPAGGFNAIEARQALTKGESSEPLSDRQNLLIDRIVARSAAFEIASKNPTKLPRRVEIHNLEMLKWGDSSGSSFHASLTNPTPRGRIDTEGIFGPWRTDDPRRTPVRGDYLFGSVNLDTIKGIGGTLSSGGTYRGVLERLQVNGHTETPDFVIDLAGQPVPLTTRFDAVVDGTNGDTWLERVDATLRDTNIVARGAVIRTTEVKGRRVSLDVTIDRGRVEDILALAVKSASPLLTGVVDLKTQMVIPANDEDIADKLQLDGEFLLAEARFANLDIQQRVNALSRRGRGQTARDGRENVVSNLRGRFVMRRASIRFSNLTFGVPGAVVELAGVYNLRAETVDFSGNLLLDATLAQMTTGITSVVVRLAQPLFRRPGGGSKLPIRISGTRSKPSFGLDFKRAFLPG
jgi:hypothetical protein